MLTRSGAAAARERYTGARARFREAFLKRSAARCDITLFTGVRCVARCCSLLPLRAAHRRALRRHCRLRCCHTLRADYARLELRHYGDYAFDCFSTLFSPISPIFARYDCRRLLFLAFLFSFLSR